MDFKNWDKTHWFIFAVSTVAAISTYFVAQHIGPAWLQYVTPVVIILFAKLGISYGAPNDLAAKRAAGNVGAAGAKPPPLPVLFLIAIAMVFIACQTVVKDVVAGANLITCVDENINLPIDQMIAKCGPDAAQIFEQRKALAAKRTCTSVVVDAGAPNGPGR